MQISLLFSALQCVITLHNSVCWATFFSCYFLYPVLFVFVFFRVMFYSRCLLLRSLMKWTHTHTHTLVHAQWQQQCPFSTSWPTVFSPLAGSRPAFPTSFFSFLQFTTAIRARLKKPKWQHLTVAHWSLNTLYMVCMPI